MIPRLLRLKNFLSYGDEVEPLDFDPIHLACLSGNNGHGKSALLDAILWALWGESRASGRQNVKPLDLINHGRRDMEVEFRFDIEGQTYLVLRRLEARGGQQSPLTTLSFQIQREGGFTSIGGDGVREAQRVIDETLKIDHETFINSAFILQGRADEFTRQAPRKRKEILANLLGLTIYSELEDKARQEARRYEERIEIRNNDLSACEREIALQDQYQAELAAAIEDLDRIDARLVNQGQEIERLDELAQQERDLQSERKRLAEDQRKAEADLKGLTDSIAKVQQRINDLESIQRREQAIIAAYERYHQLSASRDQLVAQVNELAGLRSHHAIKQREVERLHNQLAIRISTTNAQIEPLRQTAQAGERAEVELSILAAREEERGHLQTRLHDLRDQLNTLTAERQGLTTTIKTIEETQKNLRERVELLKREDAQCPVCRRPMDGKLRNEILDRFRQDWADQSNRKKELERTLKETAGRIAQINQRIHDDEIEYKHGEQLVQRIGGLKGIVQQAGQARALLEEMRVQLASLEAEHAAGVPWRELEVSLAPVHQRIGELEAATGELPQTSAELERLKEAPNDRQKLLSAGEALTDARSRLEVETRRQDQLNQQIVAVGARIAVIDARLGELAGAASRLEQAKAVQRELARQRDEALEKRSAAQQKVNVVADRKRQAEELRKDIESARIESGYLRELVNCFGPKGVQAMLIEQVAPEIQEYANQLLDLISDGRMQVQFQTQRARSGSSSTDDPIETLDIIVSDELGTRPYELFSGGEAFRINFAIRIAISKLLARRAGTRLQFLVIDEGFGSQDAAGRQRLVEAINSIADSFEKILVVTHVDELKDAFPTRIEVVKGANGSQIYVH